MSDSRPIGVFDSGIGGLTVVKALRDLLPNESIHYLGDTARVPYGPKSPETVSRFEKLRKSSRLFSQYAIRLLALRNWVARSAIKSQNKSRPSAS